MNYSQKYFVIMGIIFLFMSGFMILTGIMTHSAPPAITYPLLGMMIMSFCLSYLHPMPINLSPQVSKNVILSKKLARKDDIFYESFNS
ncbi:hypothetical protein P9158_01675, partial [Bacillus thuringiensis]|nr:hypothetical protein [Bacillus thuringiensis]